MDMLRSGGGTKAVLGLAAAGVRPVEIAAALCLRPATVSAYLSRARSAGIDVPLFPTGKPHPVVAATTQAHRNRLANLAHAGHPPREVGEIVGATAAHVSQQLARLRRAGVDVPRTRPGRGRSRRCKI